MELALTYRDYTVGWICALEVEQAAARALLDSEHPRLPSITGDPNRYRFGSISGHNVVIACLPDGETGNNPAATVAARMTMNFPSLKFGLMVGIGGGVPSPPNYNDIRLGDVVVCSASGEFGGVVQYDRGKTVQEGIFTRTGSLNRPPEVLRQAVTDLRATYRLKRSRFAECLLRIVSEFDTFASPSTTQGSQDILFRPDYDHPKGFGAPTCESCDPTQRIQRSPRSPDPAIHYGVIASGNQVMRNGTERDRISRELGGVLCFEMEAAGLMNTFPCLVIRGICDYSDSHKNKDWQAYAAAVAGVYAKELLGEIEPAVVERTPTAAAAMKPRLLPFGRNRNFVGREPQLSRLIAKLYTEDTEDYCQRVALVGLGGTGKTQIALEFAFKIQEISPKCSVFWVPAIDTTSFEQAYRKIGQQLQIPGISDDKADVKELVKTRLSQESSGKWIMIVDNADDMEMLYDSANESSGSPSLLEYLPFSLQGAILFTTRDRKAATKYAGSNVIDVEEMTGTESRELLKKALQNPRLLENEDGTTQLLKLLVNLPLAIMQAASYLNENSTTIARYLKIYEECNNGYIKLLSKNFEDEGRYPGMKNPITTTWLISFNQIRRFDSLAADYLAFMSCINPQNIPESLLPPAPLDKATDALGTLKAFSFIKERIEEGWYDIHQLVQIAMRNWLKTNNKLTALTGKTLKRIADVFPFGKHENRAIWTMYLPHARCILSFVEFSGDLEESYRILLFAVGSCLDTIGKFEEAEGIYRQVLQLTEKVLGQEHPSTLGSMNNLALVLDSQGKYEEAEGMHRRALQLREKVLGQEHPDTLASMNNLASVLKSQGKYEEAEGMHRQALQLTEKVLGQEHPSTLASMNNLASVLKSQGKYEEAEGMHRQALQLKEKVLGQEHPSTLGSMNNLALVLDSQGKYEEAEGIHRQALQLKEKVLGQEHPSTLASMNNLASVLKSQGKYEEAEGMHQQALQLKEKSIKLKEAVL